VLEGAKAYGKQVLRSTITYSGNIYNQSAETIPLFEKNLVCEGNVSLPRGVATSLLQKPEDLARFISMTIDDKQVIPDELEHSWKDERDKTKGAHYIAKSSRTITPTSSASRPMSVSYATTSLLEDSDYIIRRFLTFTSGVTITIQHPLEFEIEVVWVAPADIVKHDPTKRERFFEQRVDGVFLPGMGFFLILKRRKRDSSST
jgi:hypothetical protein